MTQAIDLLKRALPVIRETIDAAGGCDHSVGICMCPEKDLADQIAEFLLLAALEQQTDANAAAVLLQTYISECGPLSEEAGTKVRELLKSKRSAE